MAPTPEERIEKLEIRIESLSKKIDSLSKNMDKASSGIGESDNLLGDLSKTLGNVVIKSAEFALNINEQYKYAEKLALESKKTAINIGLSTKRSHQFTKSFNSAYSELAKFGFEASEVKTIMSEFSDSSGRARIMNPNEVKNIGLISKSLGLGTENVTEMTERMELMGINSEKSFKFLENLTIESQKLGLNASKVAKSLSNNFGKMSRMSFSNGVKGMTEMAKLAVKMRIDVSEMLGMSDKFYQPEAAIEAAANLQLLGGDIAKAFGDPFETMYLARNKPEELAKKLQDMTENMIQFNSETGEYEFPAEVKMQLKAAGDQLGVNVDSLIDMARQSSKIKDIKMKVSSNIIDEDMREGIASLARLNEEGNWVIDMAKGPPLELEDVGMEDAAEILAAPKDADDAIMDIARNSMTTNEILSNLEESIKAGLTANNNLYELIEDISRPTINTSIDGVAKVVSSIGGLLENTVLGDLKTKYTKLAENLGISTGKIFEEKLSNLDNIINSGLSDIKFEDLFTDSINTNTINQEGTTRTDAGEDLKIKKSNDFIVRNDGTKVNFNNQDDIIGAKKGGPLDKLIDKTTNIPGINIPNKMEFGDIKINGTIQVKSDNGVLGNVDMNKLQPMIQKMIISHLNGTFRDGGVPSGKQFIDNL